MGSLKMPSIAGAPCLLLCLSLPPEEFSSDPPSAFAASLCSSFTRSDSPCRSRSTGFSAFLRVRGLGLAKLAKFGQILQKFCNFWRARSRLYQNEILQENMRLTTFFMLYKICILLHRCNLKIFAKNRFEKSAKLAILVIYEWESLNENLLMRIS